VLFGGYFCRAPVQIRYRINGERLAPGSTVDTMNRFPVWSYIVRSHKAPHRLDTLSRGGVATQLRLANLPNLVNLKSCDSSKAQMRIPASRLLRFFLLLALCAAPVWAHNAAAAQSPKRATSTPYKGDLSIFESPGREQRLHIDRVMDILGIATGKSVADIGAGSGWFAVRAAARVGPSGTVYAVDINPDAIHYIDQRTKKESRANVKTILSTPDDPKLAKETVDAVLLLKTYHEVADPVALLKHLRPALRPGARLGIVDKNGEAANHGVGQKVVVEEAARAGYHLVNTYDFVKDDGMDYFLVFTVR
jgi:2-polyprenyl-3-methyl-5-hydroxy-6-metoxy-1,4-benzoquinol methylase